MRLKLKNPLPNFTVGKEYIINEPFTGWYTCVNDNEIVCSVVLQSFESIKDRFAGLPAKKKIIVRPCKGHTVDLLLTDKYFIVYSHTKGNNYNISGNHWKYYHSNTTGEFIPDHELPVAAFSERTILKERILVADYNRLNNAMKRETLQPV